LPEHDRSRWHRRTIEDACTSLEHALGAGAAGPFLVEAAIAALHSRAARAEDTDWEQIVALYALLEPMRPTAAVRVNRAFAVSQAHGPSVALALLDRDDDLGVNAYPYSHQIRARIHRLENRNT
jgi:RNA polymerase sigma-70 factor (ECF subfamily)